MSGSGGSGSAGYTPRLPNANCSPGFRDDDFLLFADQTVPCSLCQDLHYGLSCVAFIVGAVVFLEHILAQVRGTDLSPSLLIRHTYSVFVTSAVLLYIYLLAVPEASVQNPTDAPVLLTVLAVRIISVMSLAVQTNIQTIVTCRDILRKNRLRGHLAVDVVIRVIFVPIVIIANVSIAVTLVIVPTAFVGSSSDDSTLMSTFEQIAWVCACILVCSQNIILCYVTGMVRRVVRNHIKRRQEKSNHVVGSKQNSNGSNRSNRSAGSSGVREERLAMLKKLEQTMMSSALRLLLMGSIGAAAYAVAASIGMRFWTYHIITLLQASMAPVTVLAFYRKSVFATFELSPSGPSRPSTPTVQRSPNGTVAVKRPRGNSNGEYHKLNNVPTITVTDTDTSNLDTATFTGGSTIHLSELLEHTDLVAAAAEDESITIAAGRGHGHEQQDNASRVDGTVDIEEEEEEEDDDDDDDDEHDERGSIV